ncbi:MAG: CRISPR-associated endonuclease Cas2 [Actinomycetaceae bacterium]|nr:CRISPR-associated endonuclease Cas2 [Actinomycetaceae bacterium]
MADDPVWTMVMFDVPVKTKEQRRHATRFRNLLMDMGFGRVQYSVYVRYKPAGGSSVRALRIIRSNIPPGGKVRILFLTDQQWASSKRFQGVEQETRDETPEQLVFF